MNSHYPRQAEPRTPVRSSLIIMVISTLFTIAILSAPSAQASDIAPKVQQACSSCHGLQRICKNIGVKNQKDWAETVNRMVHKMPVLEGADVTAAIEYLSSSKPGNPEICQ